MTGLVSDKKGDPNILAIEEYAAAIQIGDRSYPAIMQVKCYLDGRRYHDDGLITLERWEMGVRSPLLLRNVLSAARA